MAEVCLFKGLQGSYQDPCIYFQIYESEYLSNYSY